MGEGEASDLMEDEEHVEEPSKGKSKTNQYALPLFTVSFVA